MANENIQELAHTLFEYIKEVCLLRQQKVLNVDKQLGAMPLHKLNDPTYIKIFNKDTVAGAPETDNDKLLVFHKPDFTPCPPPDPSLERWLSPGWPDFRQPLEYIDRLTLPPKETENTTAPFADTDTYPFPSEFDSEDSPEEVSASPEPEYEYFIDDSARVALFHDWEHKRSIWVNHEKHITHLRDLFNDLFDMYNLFRHSPDALEIMIGNGMLTDKHNKEIHHPFFLKRATLTLDSVHNTLELCDSYEPPQIYLPLFSAMEDINVDIIRPKEKEAAENNVHPWDHRDGRDLLRSVVHQLHGSSRYQDDGENLIQFDERILVKWEPYIFLRKRPDGTIKAMETILDDVDRGAPVPASLSGILGKFDYSTPANHESHDISLDWSESQDIFPEAEDILLPKPANKEQLEIVRRIAHAPAVLVQGPPGTGKTHTIANLLGHFLAEGKTVLVTSHTSKALTVLKNKVPKDLQALCVAMLDDNRADMEESINVIIERTATSSYGAQRTAAEQIRAQRHETLLALRRARHLVYAIRHKEFEPIAYFGESWSPAKAADYVAQHENLLALIPEPVSRDAAFPLSDAELEWLYASNTQLTMAEETELSIGLPRPEDLMTPQQFATGIDLLERLILQLQALNATGKVLLAWKPSQNAIINQLTDQIFAQEGDSASESALRKSLAIYEEPIPNWAVFAIADGAEDGLSRKRWERLLGLIEETFSKSQPILEKQLQRPIKILSTTAGNLKNIYKELLTDAQKHGRVKKGIFMSKEKKAALDSVSIAGNTPETSEDIESILEYLDLLILREQLGQLWDSLMAAHGARNFSDFGDEPERLCHQQYHSISFWLNWVNNTRKALCALAEDAGIGPSLIQPLNTFVSFTDDKVSSMLQHIKEQLIPSVNLLHLINELCTFNHAKETTLDCLECLSISPICLRLQAAIQSSSTSEYALGIQDLSTLLAKEEIQRKRSTLLEKIEASAPAWANAIRSRSGCHGEQIVPNNLLTSWKAHQLSQIVDEIASTPLSDAENQVTTLTSQFRKETEKLASALAWLYLRERIDQNPSMRQSLNGWKQTIAKIGKGTGKRAPELRNEARKLMIECQKAVPAWIMPVSNVMSSVDVAHTKFDVIIIDEASQSDFTASAILYMGKKIIVVGDDEQVSPLAVGIDETKMQDLMNMFIKGKIPNAHLWDPKTSLYDIAAQVYQPLMLREHFRCVPDIIGYCNMLSYQGKIKPLREAGSSPFKTAVISYRVNGIRNGTSKTNEEEAKAIVALIKACIEQPEYADKSIGVISLLGDSQIKLINRLLLNEIPLVDYEQHQILCGTASNFQGDERDIIFLSMVDSNKKNGPLSMTSGEGTNTSGKSMKQRYNVAVSRAKDQLWVIHSLDYTADLKHNDMRRRLLEYAADPHAFAAQIEHIEAMADSPFEIEVVKALVERGYHIEQQWPVGAYRLDMIAIYGNKEIAIECDGERWHSGEDKILQDMERQSNLERLGWKFIRIRGSEYYRGREQTIARVVSELNAAGVYPEASNLNGSAPQEDSLLTKIKVRATQLLSTSKQTEDSPLPTSNVVVSNLEAEAIAAPAVTIAKSELKIPMVKPAAPAKTDLISTVVAHEASVVTDTHTAESKQEVPIATDSTTPPMEPEASISKAQTVAASVISSSQVEITDISTRNTAHAILPTRPAKASPLSTEKLLSELDAQGFCYIDNRKTSGLIWVVYDVTQLRNFLILRTKYNFKYTFEKRGAKATNNVPAWCITGLK